MALSVLTITQGLIVPIATKEPGKVLADRDDLSRSDRRILKYICRRDIPLSKRKGEKPDAETIPLPDAPVSPARMSPPDRLCPC